MKLQGPNSSALSTRCQFYTPSGRQCRLPASDQNSRLCSYHLAVEKQKDTSNVYAPLIRNSQGLQTAQGINYSLSNLYELLARNHISPRRAAVLAYILTPPNIRTSVPALTKNLRQNPSPSRPQA